MQLEFRNHFQFTSIYLTVRIKSQKKIEEIISKNFNLSPRGIRELLKLNKPIYKKTAAYGHFGRQSEDDGSFSWEKIDLIKYFQSKV